MAEGALGVSLRRCVPAPGSLPSRDELCWRRNSRAGCSLFALNAIQPLCQCPQAPALPRHRCARPPARSARAAELLTRGLTDSTARAKDVLGQSPRSWESTKKQTKPKQQQHNKEPGRKEKSCDAVVMSVHEYFCSEGMQMHFCWVTARFSTDQQ